MSVKGVSAKAHMAFPCFMNSDCSVIPSTALLIFLETGLKDMSRVCLRKQKHNVEKHTAFKFE